MRDLTLSLLLSILFFSCGPNEEVRKPVKQLTVAVRDSEMNNNIQKYVSVQLSTDLDRLTKNQKQMVSILIEAASIMDELFWYEAYGDKDELFSRINSIDTLTYLSINYGPWDRLNGDKPFVQGVLEKPKGANFYPQDMSKEEFTLSKLTDKSSLYTFVRRDINSSELYTIPYHVKFKKEVTKVADLLVKASKLAENKMFKKYLLARADALLTDKYFKSDMLWMDMKSNVIDIVIGPIETYEDKLFGYKAAHEAYVLVKDLEWSTKLLKYNRFLPILQKNLPVAPKYKVETPGTDSDLNVYDVIYYAGDCNAGSKTIAINLPNDERVQLEKGTRRLQLKNVIQAKFDKILIPISNTLIDESQRKYISFDVFFENIMFHEIAHGLGVKNTINNSGSVREALKEHYSALEEGKADVLGLYMIKQLIDAKELEGDFRTHMVSFMAGIFRSMRFGSTSAHGKANVVRFNYFKQKGAFFRNNNGNYTVNFDKMELAIISLSEKILLLQGNGDYEGMIKTDEQYGSIDTILQSDLEKLSNIPVDIVFEQGKETLGL